MMIARQPRIPALLPFVDSIWAFSGQFGHRFERVLPNGRVQLLVNLSGYQGPSDSADGVARLGPEGVALQGPRIRPVMINTLEQREICGVSFTPGGAHAFFAVPMQELKGMLIDLSCLWGCLAFELRDRLKEVADPETRLDMLEAALVSHARSGLKADRRFALACGLLVSGTSVRMVEQRLGVTPRHLIEEFRLRTGLTPKSFARVERFQRLLASVDRRATWLDLALENGYSDQAHMIREFKAFSGLTPTAYRYRSSDAPNHVAEDSL